MDYFHKEVGLVMRKGLKQKLRRDSRSRKVDRHWLDSMAAIEPS